MVDNKCKKSTINARTIINVGRDKMTVTYHPNGLDNDARAMYLVTDSFSASEHPEEMTFPVKNGDRLGALVSAYKKHQAWLNRACKSGELPSSLCLNSSSPVSSIAPGLRASLQPAKAESGKVKRYYPVFSLSTLGVSGEYKKGGNKTFYIHRLGYQEAFRQAVKLYISDRQLPASLEDTLCQCIPDKSVFTEFMPRAVGIKDTGVLDNIAYRLDHVCDKPYLMVRDYGPHIVARGLLGRINHINGVAVSLAFAVREKSGAYWQSAILRYGYEGAYRRAVEKYMQVNNDILTLADKEWLLNAIPDKSAFREHLIPLALQKGSINAKEAKRLFAVLESS
ncbi:MAG: hypothetical protein ACRC2I_01085 [Plesiomonas shigelloides]